jgi:hypothetical protein
MNGAHEREPERQAGRGNDLTDSGGRLLYLSIDDMKGVGIVKEFSSVRNSETKQQQAAQR